jgi:hypothetical protein
MNILPTHWRRDLDTVFELHAGDDLCQVLEAAQPAPAFVRCHPELVDEGEHRLACHTSFRAISAVPDRRKGRLDDVRAPDRLPVRGRQIVEREKRVAILPSQSTKRA